MGVKGEQTEAGQEGLPSQSKEDTFYIQWGHKKLKEIGTAKRANKCKGSTTLSVSYWSLRGAALRKGTFQLQDAGNKKGGKFYS